MQTKKAENKDITLDALVRKYLQLDPAALAVLGAKEGASRGTVEAGLHEFMRRVLERALQSLWLPEDGALRLRTAKAPGWPDAKTYNLATLLAWAFVREPRRLRGLPQLPLYPADAPIVDLRLQPDTRHRWTVFENALCAARLFEIDFDQIRDAPGPDERQPVPVSSLIQSMLGIQPERLIRPYYDVQSDAEAAFARDPEGQATAGLSAALMAVLLNYGNVLASMTPEMDCIAFMIGDDTNYEAPDGAAAANVRTLLMAGLCADGTKEIVFVGLPAKQLH